MKSMESGALTQTDVDELVARHPLPEGTVDAVLNREEMAEALGTSLNTISAWINGGMPVQQVGANGKPYELRLAVCFAWRQAQKAAEDLRSKTARDAIEKMRLALVGGKSGDTIEALDPKQRRDIIAAQIEDERFKAHRKQLLRRSDVVELLEGLFATLRDTMEAAPDRVERIEAMPPKAVQAFIDVCDGVIADFEKRVTRFWDLNREDRSPERRELFDA